MLSILPRGYHVLMRIKRVLMANELTSYRQTIAHVLREMRPDVEVIEADSGALNLQVLRMSPDLVICSRVTSLVRDRVPNWVELYPECQPVSTFCVGGKDLPSTTSSSPTFSASSTACSLARAKGSSASRRSIAP